MRRGAPHGDGMRARELGTLATILSDTERGREARLEGLALFGAAAGSYLLVLALGAAKTAGWL